MSFFRDGARVEPALRAVTDFLNGVCGEIGLRLEDQGNTVGGEILLHVVGGENPWEFSVYVVDGVVRAVRWQDLLDGERPEFRFELADPNCFECLEELLRSG